MQQLTGTFDLTFDRTFRDVLGDSTTAAVQAGCRKEGIQLTWLTLQGGWMYWVFEGEFLRGQQPVAKGTASQGGLSLATKKETAQTLTLHTAGLTESEADALCTIRESVSVYWLKYNDDDSIEAIRVSLPVAEGEAWNSRNYTNAFSFQIILPSRRSQQL